jgi:hypothetical protein
MDLGWLGGVNLNAIIQQMGWNINVYLHLLDIVVLLVVLVEFKFKLPRSTVKKYTTSKLI